MAKKFHINPESGAVSLCRAHQGNCPFGGEETHFDSIADARAGFERSMEDQTVPKPKATGLKELNEQVKTTTDEEVLKKAIEIGSTRTLQNMAKNEAVGGDILVLARNSTKDEKTRQALVKHDNFPLEEMSIDEYTALVKENPWMLPEKFTASDAITDAHVEALGSLDYRMLKNINNKISSELIVREAEKNRNTLIHAVKNNRYPVQDRIDHIDLDNFHSAIGNLTNPADIASVATKAIDEDHKYAKWAIASNANTSHDTLDDLAGYSEDRDTLLRIYNNPNADESLKKFLSAKSETVKSLDRIHKLNEQYEGKLGEIIGTGAETSSDNYRSQKRIVRMNAAKVKELGLTTTDVDTYVRYFRGNYLFGASYDAGSGTYSGYID